MEVNMRRYRVELVCESGADEPEEVTLRTSTDVANLLRPVLIEVADKRYTSCASFASTMERGALDRSDPSAAGDPRHRERARVFGFDELRSIFVLVVMAHPRLGEGEGVIVASLRYEVEVARITIRDSMRQKDLRTTVPRD
jgi:hypothetical protein